jgi:hypothetical protein
MSKEEKRAVRRKAKETAALNGRKINDWATTFVTAILQAGEKNLTPATAELLSYFYAKAKALCKDDLSITIVKYVATLKKEIASY